MYVVQGVFLGFSQEFIVELFVSLLYRMLPRRLLKCLERSNDHQSCIGAGWGILLWLMCGFVFRRRNVVVDAIFKWLFFYFDMHCIVIQYVENFLPKVVTVKKSHRDRKLASFIWVQFVVTPLQFLRCFRVLWRLRLRPDYCFKLSSPS